MRSFVPVNMLDLHDFCAVADDNIDGRPGSYDDVAWFDISMEESFPMKILDGLPNLEHDLQGVFAFETCRVVMNFVLKTAPSTELHDEDAGDWVVLVLTVVDELDNLGLHKYMLSNEIQYYSTERPTWFSLVKFLASFRR